MRQAYQDVLDFHQACDVPVLEAPTIPPAERVQLRRELLKEEYAELDAAVEAEDLVEIADGIADLIYIAIGTALEYGIPLPQIWDEIQRSNMRKIDPETGKARRREDGKILKPVGWEPPNIRRVLGFT